MAFVRVLAGLEPVLAAGVPAGLLERRYGVPLQALGAVAAGSEAPSQGSVQPVQNSGEHPAGLPPDAAAWLEAAATRHTSGDTARMSQRLLDDFRRGVLGPIALELPTAAKVPGQP